MSTDHVPQPAVKLFAAWAGVGVADFLQKAGISTWGDAAAAAATCYSLILISEWVYKKVYLRFRRWRLAAKIDVGD